MTSGHAEVVRRSAPFEATARIDRFAGSIGGEAWFAASGEPATDAEARAARRYLEGLGLGTLSLRWLKSLDEASAIIRDPAWSRSWADAEQEAVAALTRELDAQLGHDTATERLNRLMSDAGTTVFGFAAAAAARAGIADQGLIRAMAGAASQACFEMALASALDRASHPAADKYRLFTGGRWPLVVIGDVFHIL